jgi:hypothetical protein
MELQEIKNEFIILRAQGWSFDKISKKLGKAKQTLIDWSKELQDEIKNLKALELEELYQKYYLMKESRIVIFGELVNKLRDEAKDRDLSTLPTEKLLDLLIKYDKLLQEEAVELDYKSLGEMEKEKSNRAIKLW